MDADRAARRAGVVGTIALTALIAAVVVGVAPGWLNRASAVPHPDALSLSTGWAIASSADVEAGGSQVSRAGFPTTGWTPASVPATVLGALTAHGRYPNLYAGTTINRVSEAPFAVPWWYRTEFQLTSDPGASTWLHLDGINDRADVWLNGRKVAGGDRIVGTFRSFDLDVSGAVRTGTNTLAIRVAPVDPKHDLTITWIDWNPLPPDHGMGIWQPVTLTRTGPVTIANPQVLTQMPLPDTTQADLTVEADVANPGPDAVRAHVSGAIGRVSFAQEVELAAGESGTVSFDPSIFRQLHLTDPSVWWPYRMGDQPIEHLRLTVSVDGALSDTTSAAFGIRQVTSALTSSGHRVFSVNGRPVLIRGGGWASDMLLRPQPGRVDAQLAYVRDMGLNTVRLEGKLESDHFFDEADRLGILVMPGWMCCDRWQKNARWSQEDFDVAAGSMTTQAIRMRNHPSVITFMIGSDTRPPPAIAQMYVDRLHAARWPTPILASASEDTSPVTGPTGVKMTGPYDWVPPGYWYDRTAPGAAVGFNTETSGGASIPELEDLRRMLTPAEQQALWTSPRTPQLHAGTGASVFANFRIFDRAMAARLGGPSSVADYVKKAQVLQYESERAMFEAFSRNRYASTGVIQWMLNNAWPSLHWNLFDHYLEPNGSTFGAKIANEPLHIQYGYDDHGVSVVNDTIRGARGLDARVQAFDLNGNLRYQRAASVSVPAGHVADVLRVPVIPGIAGPYFLRLELLKDRRAVSTNTYWLAPTMDRSDLARSRWYTTPTSHYADLRSLSALPTAVPRVRACAVSGAGSAMTVRVALKAPSDAIAFFVRLRAMDREGADITPITWSDNDVTLMPGERRAVIARASFAEGTRVVMSGWNVPSRTLAVSPC